MSSPLTDLEPQLLWRHFDAIRRVPRPSKHEERISAHVTEWARSNGWTVDSDDAGNLVVRVPATSGHEGAETIVLQSHLDMVCEKNSDVEHDFMSDPIEVEVEGDWVRSKGTTLGADNGVGVASAMAIAEDPDVVHGPLELLFTLDEETGLTGAKELDAGMLQGDVLINLDTEEDGMLYIGCAGGADSAAVFPLRRGGGLPDADAARVAVTGLKGGHSGLDIIENRGNAIKLVTRVLLAAMREIESLELVSLAGGSKHNAIPREAWAEVRVPAGAIETLQRIAAEQADGFRDEFGSLETDLAVAVEPLPSLEQRPMDTDSRDRLLHAINGIPHGVLSMSRDVPGLVESSNNLATAATEEGRAVVTTSHRSSVMPALDAVQSSIRSVCILGGADVAVHDPYPGWKPEPDSELVRRTAEAFRTALGEEPGIKAVHAGLECGLLLEKKPGMQAVSIGPEIRNPHSPDERVQISSVARYYRHLKELVASYARA